MSAGSGATPAGPDRGESGAGPSPEPEDRGGARGARGGARSSVRPEPGSTPEAQGIVGRVGRLVGRILGWGPVPIVTRVLDTYGYAGGGLLATGLAFGALFALIPATLLIVGVAGFVIADPSVRDEVLGRIVALVPPLEPFVTVALNQLAAGAVAITLVGLAGFLWTSSQFYGQIDHAFALILESPRRRDMIERTIRGLIVIALVIALFIVLVGASVVTTAGSSLPIVGAVENVLRVLSPVLAYVGICAIIAAMYRVVPTQRVPWRAIWLPALVVAAAEAILTGLFVLIAPFLASPRIFGPFVTLFATLAWLSWTFQILLYGLSWVSERMADLAGAPNGGADGRGAPSGG